MKGDFLEGLTDIFGKALELIYPARCPFCDGVLPFGELSCESCERRIVYEMDPRCVKCGRNIGDDSDASLCFDCRERSHEYDHGYCLLSYRSVSKSLYRLKYKGRREYARWYGRQMVRVLREQIGRMAPQVIVPVPLHRRRMAARGYNQAGEIAAEMSRWLCIPVDNDLVVRTVNTQPMKNVDSAEKRRNNLKNAFQISKNVVEYDRVLVVDDIYTSGATIDAVARELKRAGVAHVYFAAAAGSHI